jgi:hypothetical protein
MSFNRWGLAPLALAVMLGFASTAQAEGLEYRPSTPAAPPLVVGDSDLGLDLKQESSRELSSLDAITLGDLQLIEDFHPETDRWTDRNNRIRITMWTGAWLFSKELRIHHDVPVGFRISWEVPGFISIRWDSGFAPWSRMEVKGRTSSGNLSSRWMSGVVHNHTLSLGIFNPELSVSGLAFWAGFGAGIWVYNYNEADVFGDTSDQGIDAEFSDTNISGLVFIELDYEISDTFHVGLGIRQHALLADHTNDGRFYEFNGVQQTKADAIDRNDGQFDDLAGVTEITFNISVLF